MSGIRSVLRPPLRSALRGGQTAEAAFVGPLDLLSTPAVAAWSVARRLTRSYDGPLIRLRRTSDDAEMDFGFDGAGDLLVAEIATWLSGNDGRVATIFDQSGNEENFEQTNLSQQPLFSFDGCGDESRPGFQVLTGHFLSRQSSNLDNLWNPIGMTLQIIYTLSNSPAQGRYIVQKSNATLFQNWYIALLNSTKICFNRCSDASSVQYGPGYNETTKATYVDLIASAANPSTVPTWLRNGASISSMFVGGVGAGVASEAGVALAWPAKASGQQEGVYSELILFRGASDPPGFGKLNEKTTDYFNGL